MARKEIQAQDLDFSKHVVEFRPPPGFFGFDAYHAHLARKPEVYRYADGRWLPDDGKHDLAFISPDTLSESGNRFTSCLYFELPYRKNIRWSWYDCHWSSKDRRHPGGNAWHYMLVPGMKDIDSSWDRDRHANEVAKESGFARIRELGYGSSAGRSIELKPGSEAIELGLARIKGSGQIIVPPKRPLCVYCSDETRLEGDLRSIEASIRQYIADSPDPSDALANVEDMVNGLLDE